LKLSRNLEEEEEEDLLKYEVITITDHRLLKKPDLKVGLWLGLGLGSWNCGIQTPIGDAGNTLIDR